VEGNVPIRYLGSKSRVAATIAREVLNGHPTQVVDLFAGVGHLSSGFAMKCPVHSIDVSAFAAEILMWRIASGPRDPDQVAATIEPIYAEHQSLMSDAYAREREAEATFFASPSAAAFMEVEASFGSEPGETRCRLDGSLITSYFANSYFGVRQAIELDAIRCALSRARSEGRLTVDGEREGLIALLCAMTHLSNSPGHFAQWFAVEGRVSEVTKLWSRGVWTQWRRELHRMRPAGTVDWRRGNRVTRANSLELDVPLAGRPVMLADPPYTEAQYSRFYHVLETTTLYDYPECHHRGRYRSDRYKSPFSHRTGVIEAFRSLFDLTLRSNGELFVTYPECAMLHKAGSSIPDVAMEVGLRATRISTYELAHAAPGRGQARPKIVKEELWRVDAQSR